MTFKEWFYNAPHRAQYTENHPTYFVAKEAWSAAHEACAKVCDAVQKKNEDDGAFMWEARNCAAAIRARGES